MREFFAIKLPKVVQILRQNLPSFAKITQKFCEQTNKPGTLLLPAVVEASCLDYGPLDRDTENDMEARGWSF
jgi:hypothetical protein